MSADQVGRGTKGFVFWWINREKVYSMKAFEGGEKDGTKFSHVFNGHDFTQNSRVIIDRRKIGWE